MVRQGGRSARIQKAVHMAVRSLLEQMDRSELTVPMIAERAGVTPSTIYRRWGDISQLLADVAVERMRPAAEPDDTGTPEGDVEAFVLQYAEEMSTPVGRALLRDVIADAESDLPAVRCCQFTYDSLDVISMRAVARGEVPLDVAGIVDQVVAPIVYHILFADRDVGPDYCRALLGRAQLRALPDAA
jgi:AcrR family transcriptional regulator